MIRRSMIRPSVIGPAVIGPIARRADLRRAAIAAIIAVVMLPVVTYAGGTHAPALQQRLIAWGASAVFALFGCVAVRSTANELAAVAALRAGTSATSTLRLMVTVLGYVLVILTVLGLLAVPLERLLLSGAITGVIIGIAAQQSLGNLFAGFVLMFSRPFTVGDWIVLHSGALGGTHDGQVMSIGLTYTVLATQDGPLSLPNSAVLAGASGRRRDPRTHQAPVGNPASRQVPEGSHVP